MPYAQNPLTGKVEYHDSKPVDLGQCHHLTVAEARKEMSNSSQSSASAVQTSREPLRPDMGETSERAWSHAGAMMTFISPRPARSSGQAIDISSGELIRKGRQ